MKKLCVVVLLLALYSSAAFAVDFAPPVLKLTAAPIVQYGFDGTTLSLPVTVTGSPAGTFFLVYTKDQAESIGEVRNGFLGWHYVNKVDTCMYVSEFKALDIGSNTIEWDGKDNDGKIVPAGEYTYYMWAYDNQNVKQYASKQVRTITHNLCAQVNIQETDENGNPLANPYVYFTQYETGYKGKWVIGKDPDDATLLETCNVYWGESWSVDRVVIPVPTNQSQIFASGGVSASEGTSKGVYKFDWVPNGDATPVTEWGENGYAGISEIYDAFAGPATDGNYVYFINQSYHDYFEGAMSELVYITVDDGTVEDRKDMSDWWSSPADLEGDGQLNGGPNGIMVRNGYIFMGSHSSCLVQMVDPNGEDYMEDGVKWANKNGDYVFDHHFAEDATKPWVCNDYKTPPFWTSFNADANNFALGPLYDLGAISFALAGPDGTGIGNFAYAAETASRKYYENNVDYDSPYDGIYSDNTSSVSKEDNPDQIPVAGLMWIGHDSIKGVITNDLVAVEEAAPDAFTVGQNSPNPFNPTTAINFSIPDAGNVDIDVFNAAGQKVDTIVSDFLSAGNHTITWDASGLSAGVYFYSVKAGNFSKTMKMTLLK